MYQFYLTGFEFTTNNSGNAIQTGITNITIVIQNQ